MKKEDLLQPTIEQILVKLDLISRYRSIWERYAEEDESYRIKDQEILETFESLGYSVRKCNIEQYFSEWFEKDRLLCRVGISMKYNLIHFDFSLKNEEFGINSGGDFGLLIQMMTNWEMPIKSPGFDCLETFRRLMGELIALFEEIHAEATYLIKPI